MPPNETLMVRMGYQYPPCRFNDVLYPVRSEKSLLKAQLRLGIISITPELEPGFENITKTVHLEEKEDVDQIQKGTGILDFVKSGLSLVKQLGINTAESALKQKVPGLKTAIEIGEIARGPVGTKISNILSETFNNNPAWRPGFSGESHILLPTKFGLTRANYAGPGTLLQTRLDRGDIGVDGPNGIDIASRTHDILYQMAKSVDDIRAADNRLIRDIEKGSQGKKTKKLAIAMLKAKKFGENIGVFGPETFTDLPGLHNSELSGGRIVKQSNTGEVGLSNSLTGSISGGRKSRFQTVVSSKLNMMGKGRDMNMMIRGMLGDIMTPQTMNIHGNYLNPYNEEIHKFGNQTGLGSPNESFDPAGGGIASVEKGEKIIEKLVKDIPLLPGTRLKEQLLNTLAGKQLPSRMHPRKQRRSPFYKKTSKQHGGQFGLLAGLAASFIIPEIVKLFKKKSSAVKQGMHGTGVTQNIEKEILKLVSTSPIGKLLQMTLKKEPKLKKVGVQHLVKIARQHPDLKGSGLHTAGQGMHGGQFGLLAGLVSSLIVPEIVKLFKKKKSSAVKQAGKGFGFDILKIALPLLGPILIGGIKDLFSGKKAAKIKFKK